MIKNQALNIWYLAIGKRNRSAVSPQKEEKEERNLRNKIQINTNIYIAFIAEG